MNLEELCQPLIDYISDIYRIAQNGGKLDLFNVRHTIQHFFDRMQEATFENAEMAGELDKIKLPLVFFVDFMIKEGPFPFKNSWEELGREYNELSGDEKFFDILDDNLNDPSSLATQRLRVFYQCMGAGFTGCYSRNPEYVERKMKVCALRIGIESDMTSKERVTEKCYQNILKDKEFVDPTLRVRKIFLFTLIIFFFVFLMNYLSFHHAVKPLEKKLDQSLVSAWPAEEKEGFFNVVRRYLPSILREESEKKLEDQKKVPMPEKTPADSKKTKGAKQPAKKIEGGSKNAGKQTGNEQKTAQSTEMTVTVTAEAEKQDSSASKREKDSTKMPENEQPNK